MMTHLWFVELPPGPLKEQALDLLVDAGKSACDSYSN